MSERPETYPLIRAFVSGLVRPSATAVLTAIATVLLLAGAFVLTVNERLMASDGYRYFMSGPVDSQTFVTHQVLARSKTPGPSTIVLGSSVVVHCIETNETLGQAITAAGGPDFPAIRAATDAQAPWEMAAIVDRAPPGDGGVLVIGLTPGILSTAMDGPGFSSLETVIKTPKLGFTSDALDDEARRAGFDVPLRTGVYALDNFNYLVARRKQLVKNLLRGGQDYGEPLDESWLDHVNRPEFWKQEIEDLAPVSADYSRNLEANLAVIERMVANARKTGDITVVVLESPLNPGWWEIDAGRAFFARYQSDLQRLADRLDGTFFSVTAPAGLTQADFVDYEGHVGTPEARARCTEGLAQGIAAAWRAEG